jgi:hypothetical protein
LQQSVVYVQERSSQVPEASDGALCASSDLLLDELDELDPSLDDSSLGTSGVPEGSALVSSTSPPGDWYWLTHAHSEQPIRLIRNKEQNDI